ncbi:MAG: hypothetical protein J07HX64_00148 [halophilic archaeon J07HX64]|nr:MAG: hypothetical protein J07HX64_00148 [halophilic archaeon J07HX64]
MSNLGVDTWFEEPTHPGNVFEPAGDPAVDTPILCSSQPTSRRSNDSGGGCPLPVTVIRPSQHNRWHTPADSQFT